MKNSMLNRAGIGIWCTAVVAGMVACGGGGGGQAAPGTLRVAMTDAPACGFDHVYVTIEKVRVHQSSGAGDGEGGWTELEVSPPRRVDLLALNNGILEELGAVALPAGQYSQVRLVLADNRPGAAMANAIRPTGGSEVALSTPSAQQSGLKLQAHFDVPSGQTADLLLDFNACKSIVTAGTSGQYILKPVVAVVPRVGSTIQGFVTTTLSLSSTTVAAQQNGTTVRSTTPDAQGSFKLPYLTPGTYTVVITSEGRATGVVTSVPAGSTPTVVSTAASAITLPTSTMAEVTGTVSAGATAVTDASVRATQSLSGLPIEVRNQPVDAVLGTYQLRLPTAAAVKAAYAASGPLAFSPDSASAGKYTVEAQAPNRAVLSKTVDAAAAPSTQVDFGY